MSLLFTLDMTSKMRFLVICVTRSVSKLTLGSSSWRDSERRSKSLGESKRQSSLKARRVAKNDNQAHKRRWLEGTPE